MIGRDMERSLRPHRNLSQSSNTRTDQNASVQPSTNQDTPQPVYSSRLRLRSTRSARQETPQEPESSSATPGTRRFISDEEDHDDEKEEFNRRRRYQTRTSSKEETHLSRESAFNEAEAGNQRSPDPQSNEDKQPCTTDLEATEPNRSTRLRPSRAVRSYNDTEPEVDLTAAIRRSSRITVLSKQKKPFYGEMTDDNVDEGESSGSNRTYGRRDFDEDQQTEICEVKTYVPTSRPGLRARAEINYGDCGGYVIRPPPIRRQRSSLEDVEDDETSIPKSYDLRPRMPKSYKENLLLGSPSKADRRRQDRRNRSRSPSPRYHPHRSRRDRYGRDDHDPFNSDDENAENGIAKSRRLRPANVRSQILPINLSQKELAERPLYTSSPSDLIGTESSSASGFDLVGGLDHIVFQVKESIVLPLLYPELCKQCTPARGILFSGPPGTGKTLLGKAVAQACSKDGRKVAFFHVRGPEIMSKWYGESERNLRGIFEAAKRFQPSVIFFDEIDGLAPSRNSQSDQHYTSVVTTLLTLMDGIEDRGQVVVIGATNRKEAVDSALRRPGRFDKEFIFTLPNETARNSILKIHTSTWEEYSPSDELRKELAYMTEGFSGADLKSLCNEASMCAIRRRYPQIFQSDVKLLVDPAQVIPKRNDFLKAFESITPTSLRSEEEQACPLPPRLEPLLREPMEKALHTLDFMLPGSRDETKYNGNVKMIDPRIFKPRMLISGHAGMGQQIMAHAILHYLSGYYIQSFDLASLHRESASMESVCIELFLELKCRAPAVIYLPRLDKWWESASVMLRNTFHCLLETLDPSAPILLLATIDVPESSLLSEIRPWFGGRKTGRIALESPSKISCQEFFQDIVNELLVPPSEENCEDVDGGEVDELPIAPIPKPRQLTKEELLARRSAEGKVFSELSRELKAFLEVIAPMRSYRTFYTSRPPPYLPPGTFSDGTERQRIRTLLETAPSSNDELLSPGNPNGAPNDHHAPTLTLQLVTDKVIDLETIYRRIYSGQYCSVEEFTNDVEKVCSFPEAFGDSLLPDDNKCWTIYTKAEDIRAKLATLREHIPEDLLEESKRMLAQLELDTSMGFWPLTDSSNPIPGKGKRQFRTPTTTSRITFERKMEHNREEIISQPVNDIDEAEGVEEGEDECVGNEEVGREIIPERAVEGISSASQFVQKAVDVGFGKPLDLLVEMKAHLLSIVDLHRRDWDKSDALQECIRTLSDWV